MGMRTHVIKEDLIMEILILLPVKSLLRFKCVAKFWKALISEPNFKKMHLNFHARSKTSQKLLIGKVIDMDTVYFYSCSLSSIQIVKDIQRLDWPLCTKPLYGRVECCCDGLLLIGVWTQPSDLPSLSQHTDLPSMLLLWNPSTRESIILPNSEFPSKDFIYGLGYDSKSDDYKVLRIDFDDLIIEILSLKNDSWRNIGETSRGISSGYGSDRDCLAFVHGAFHWFGSFTVITLDVSNETYGEISYPEIVHSLPPNGYLGMSVLGGLLCIYLNDYITFSLWLMNDYGVKESWIKSLSIPSNGVSLIPMYKLSNDEVLVKYSNHSGEMMLSIIGSSGISNRIWPLGSDEIAAITIQDGFAYSESLVSPK